MEFLVNDLSLHGQFSDPGEFKAAIVSLMRMRAVARRYGRELNCHRGLSSARVTADKTMQQAVHLLSKEEQRSLMQWLTQQGPFWDDVRVHCSDEWLESNGNVVTDTALGEAAWCCLRGLDHRLVSFSPSSWQFSPVPVVHVVDQGDCDPVSVVNYWNHAAVERDLLAAPPTLASWRDLAVVAQNRFAALTLSKDAFLPLDGSPFAPGAAERILVVLGILERFLGCFDSNGERTQEGHEVYRDFFTGKKGNGGRGALFSDSSDDEKSKFEQALSFQHPEGGNRKLFCSWHGKVQTPQLRVHFSWPVRAGKPLYVVYIGPKITKG